MKRFLLVAAALLACPAEAQLAIVRVDNPSARGQHPRLGTEFGVGILEGDAPHGLTDVSGPAVNLERANVTRTLRHGLDEGNIGVTQLAPGTCRRSVGPLALQLIGGLAGAWVGGIAPYLAIDDIDAPDRKVKGDAGYQPNANTAFAIGSWVGSTLGVYGVGKAFYPNCGSFGKTAVGTGVISAFLLLGREEPYLPIIGIVFVAPVQSLVGTVAFGR